MQSGHSGCSSLMDSHRRAISSYISRRSRQRPPSPLPRSMADTTRKARSSLTQNRLDGILTTRPSTDFTDSNGLVPNSRLNTSNNSRLRSSRYSKDERRDTFFFFFMVFDTKIVILHFKVELILPPIYKTRGKGKGKEKTNRPFFISKICRKTSSDPQLTNTQSVAVILAATDHDRLLSWGKKKTT